MYLTEERVFELKKIAGSVRKTILETVHYANAGHVGGPFSATDMLVTLYFDIMNLKPEDPKWDGRDRFVLSKGHSALALYSVLGHRGYFPIEEMKTFDRLHSRFQAHPDMTVLPGLDMSTGSLGQGISTAVGMALGAKKMAKDFTVYCMVGDGETQEGQVWEAAEIAYRYQLDNLIVFMDYNKLQQYGWKGKDQPRDIPVVNPAKKWEAFGWNVLEINGHDYQEIVRACQDAKKQKGKPTVIVANTIKGKGVSFMQNQYLWHSKVPTDEELAKAFAEIDGEVNINV